MDKKEALSLEVIDLVDRYKDSMTLSDMGESIAEGVIIGLERSFDANKLISAARKAIVAERREEIERIERRIQLSNYSEEEEDQAFEKYFKSRTLRK